MMTKHSTPTREYGMTIARRMKQRLRREGIPVIAVYLFGSLASEGRKEAHDVDIAVVHESFAETRSQERQTIRALREDFDVPMDIICLRPADLENGLLGIARTVKEQGIAA